MSLQDRSRSVVSEDRGHYHGILGQVAILGVGLIGGSLGQVLCAVHAAESVVGWDPDEATLQTAIAETAIHRAAATPEEAAFESSLVVIAAPLEAITALLRQVAPHLGDGAVVTDVGSAKARVVREAEALVGGCFVGGHPMAGSEYSGIGASSVDLFDAAPWVLTPTARTDPAALRAVQQMAVCAGASPRLCDPETHDAIIAYLSHLPHLLAYGLTKTAADGVAPEWADLMAGSFRDGTRVANSDPQRWTDIILDNRAAALIALDRFIAWAQDARDRVDRADAGALAGLLAEAHQARARFPR